MEEQNLSPPPSPPQPPTHVLIFPFPVQGHVNSMLKLAELLCSSGRISKITFLNNHHNHHSLLRFSDVQNRFSSFPGFHFHTISDGLPSDHPRSGNYINELIVSIKTITKTLFRELLLNSSSSSDSEEGSLIAPVTCIIADGLMLSITADSAEEMGIPLIAFRTISACSYWAYFCIPQLIESGEIPFIHDEDEDEDRKEENDSMDMKIMGVPGMESFLRRRDLPSFCRVKEVSDPLLQIVITETRSTTRASALIFNTFEELEAPVLSEIRSYRHHPNVYTIGPLHAQVLNSTSNSLREEDRSCITWLDSKPSESVLYVSFGSIAVFTRQELLEFWYGLVNSGKPFLWVIRLDSLNDKDDDTDDDPTGMKSWVPKELKEATKERGCLVGWAPQEEVLAHPAVGGFLTHSGWNSTLESIVAGVPMICWPYFADQQLNSRFVSEVWKVGVDMKDVCERGLVEKMVKEVMEERKEEFRTRASKLAQMAKEAITPGGTSKTNLDTLIQHITSHPINLSSSSSSLT